MLLWVIVGGIGSGAAFVIALSLLSLRARSAEETAKLSGMSQSLGYLLASAGPVAAGALAEATQTWTAPLIVLVLLCLVQVVVAVPAARPNTSVNAG